MEFCWTNLVESPSPYVSADPVQLQQVILNLITNAIDAMSASKQGARILLIETNIDQDDTVVITVADTGPGFDSKVAAQLFKPFFTTKSSGMGLGLPICKSIIEAHQGTLTVASREPHGAVLPGFQCGLRHNDAAWHRMSSRAGRLPSLESNDQTSLVQRSSGKAGIAFPCRNVITRA